MILRQKPGYFYIVISIPPVDGSGAVTTFAVSIEDQYGNVVTSAGSTDSITVTLYNSGNLLSSFSLGSPTVTASGGAATFSGLFISNPDTYTLSATDSTEPSIQSSTSNHFDVNTMDHFLASIRTKRDTGGQFISIAMLRESFPLAIKENYALVDAIVDTGATRSAIPQHIVDLLGLTVSRQGNATLADGRYVSVGVSSPISFEIEGRKTSEDAYIVGDTVLVGQTVLVSTDLLVDCTNRKVVPGHPGGPVLRL